jgi:hypothetical protein
MSFPACPIFPSTWTLFLLVTITLARLPYSAAEAVDGEWVSLFNGKDLVGWEAPENPSTFQVVDGVLVVKGDRGHLFYTGPVGNHDFTDFEWKCDVLTKPGANSGMYFHTAMQPEGWLTKGCEAQIDNSHIDPRRTGGIYGIADVMDDCPAKDNEWFTQHVIVRGKRIIIKVNGKVTTDYTEPDSPVRTPGNEQRVLSHGTLAIQGHDPGSEVHFRNIMVRVPPSADDGFVALFDGKSLDGWVVRGGKAKYAVEDGVIVGTSQPNTSNTFLCTEQEYGDFVLEYEILADSELNSGVQIRSQVFDKDTTVNLGEGNAMNIPAGRVHGYQVEYDANVPRRAWLAGIYDEGRRAWLVPGPLGGDPTKFTEQGKRLYKPGDWNHIRVEAQGPSIKTYLNGELRADMHDDLTPSGFIGLQVHGVRGETKPLKVRWRNLRIKELN